MMAVDALKKSNMSSNVPYSIKEGADLNEAIQAGLNVCDDFEDRLTNSEFSTITCVIISITMTSRCI